MRRYWAAQALVGDDLADRVAIEVGDDGRIAAVRPGVDAAPAALRLGGVVLPGVADAHSHAFHRALRGRTGGSSGTFWTWRERMYAVAEVLDPDLYRALATGVFAECAMSGVTAVAEFHYLHHGPGGRAYADPNAMGLALVDAARAAGIRLGLIDTCYLHADVDRSAPHGAQRRFADPSVAGWSDRVDALASALAGADDVVVGAAAHSIRATTPDEAGVVATWARDRGAPCHIHLSEQPAENDASRATHGASPTAVLAEVGFWDAQATAVHAVHLDDGDIDTLGGAGVTICACPTTEADLGDGVGPFPRLVEAGCALALGRDSHAVGDPFAEARALEGDQRLIAGRRGITPAATVLDALGPGGQAASGFRDAGQIEVGARADLVAVCTDTVRTAGALPPSGSGADRVLGLIGAATGADISDVVVDGRHVVAEGRHATVDAAAELAAAIAEIDARLDARGATP